MKSILFTEYKREDCYTFVVSVPESIVSEIAVSMFEESCVDFVKKEFQGSTDIHSRTVLQPYYKNVEITFTFTEDIYLIANICKKLDIFLV